MYSVKEKISNVASAAKAKKDISKAKVQEKAAKATARTKEEKVIVEERRKAKEAGAKMDLHMAKAEHAAETLDHKHNTHGIGRHHMTPHQHHPVGTMGPTTGTTAGLHHNKHI